MKKFKCNKRDFVSFYKFQSACSFPFIFKRKHFYVFNVITPFWEWRLKDTPWCCARTWEKFKCIESDNLICWNGHLKKRVISVYKQPKFNRCEYDSTNKFDLKLYFSFAHAKGNLFGSDYFLRGDPPPRGDPFGHKTPNFWDIKLQIFGAEGAENFEKFRIFKENRLFLEF